MPINVRTWSGSHTARITDMTNAGKRGKRCRVLCFIGHVSPVKPDHPETAYTLRIYRAIAELDRAMSFDAAAELLVGLICEAYAAGCSEYGVRIFEEDIRGVDAPREVLEAGIAGKWHARADEDGIGLYDDEDRNNEPAMITAHEQGANKAYDIARKCWHLVKAAPSFHAAGEILRQHGARLHYYCRMD